jgi:hypothetical protein
MAEKDARTVVEDYVEAWAAKFPQSRFTGHTVGTARMSVAPQEVVDLVAAAVCAELRLQAATAPQDAEGMDHEDIAYREGLMEMARRLCARADEIEAQS